MNQKVGFYSIDDKIDEQILGARRVFLSTSVTSESASEIIRKVWYLALKDSQSPILFVINSPGGSIDAGLAIWDQMKMISVPIITLVTGLAASMGSVLSLVAEKGNRLATPNARIMIHQPSIHGVIEGQASDLEIQASEILKTKNKLINLYMEATGKDFSTIEKALDRDSWMSVEEAHNFGLIDKIISNFGDV